MPPAHIPCPRRQLEQDRPKQDRRERRARHDRELLITRRRPNEKTVFKSCEVVPPLKPRCRRSRRPKARSRNSCRQSNRRAEDQHVNSSVAIVMPRWGWTKNRFHRSDATIRHEQKPNATMSSAPSRFMCSDGTSITPAISTTMPMPRPSSTGRDRGGRLPQRLHRARDRNRSNPPSTRARSSEANESN